MTMHGCFYFLFLASAISTTQVSAMSDLHVKTMAGKAAEIYKPVQQHEPLPCSSNVSCMSARILVKPADQALPGGQQKYRGNCMRKVDPRSV